MKTIEKKFFRFIANYNGQILTGKKWFVCYDVACFKTGKMLKRKYYGEINKYQTAEERQAECERIAHLIKSGQELPNLRGARSKQKPAVPRNFASVVKLLEDAIEARKPLVDKYTYGTYKSKYKLFIDWMDENGHTDLPIGAFTEKIARQFLSSLKEKKYSNNTYNFYKIVLGSLWEDIRKELNDTLPMGNPWREIKTMKKIVQPYKIYTLEMERKIESILPTFDPQLWLYIQFVHYGFIRGKELQMLRVDDINFSARTIRISSEIAKNDTQRTVTIPNPLYDELMRMEIYNYERDAYIFSADGKPSMNPVYKGYFRHRWRKFREAHDIPDTYKIYAWKHTGMVKAKESGIDLKDIQLQADHHSLDQVSAYLATLSASQLDNLRVKFPKIGESAKASPAFTQDNFDKFIAIMQQFIN
ncbi:MAG: site-specific integrase [Smithella sp.]